MPSDNPKFPIVFEDIASKPILIHSEEHLRRECESRGLDSVHLINATMKARKTKHKKTYSFNKKTGKMQRVK